MTSWSRPGRCSGGCGCCRRGPGCISCLRWACSRIWATCGSGASWPRAWPAWTVPRPSEKALRDLRRRLGPAPLKALFEVVAGPLAQPHTPGVRFAGLRTVAFDGLNSLKIPDTGRNRCLGREDPAPAGPGRIPGAASDDPGRDRHPRPARRHARLGTDRDEAGLARRLLHLLGPGMLVLLDRAFDSNAFLAQIAATGAVPLARAKSTRTPVVLRHLPDGSYLSCLDGLDVRIIEASVVMTGADGSRIADSYRLITTLADHRAYPAADSDPALPRAVGNRVRLPGNAAHPARWPRAALRRPARRRAGAVGTADRSTSCCAWPWSPPSRPSPAPTPTGPASPPRWKLPATSSPPPRGSARKARPTCPAPSAAPSWPPCCPPAVPASAPARSNAPPPATSTTATSDPTPSAPSPRSPSPSAPRPCNAAARASKRRPHRKTSALIGPQRPTHRQLITAIITSQPPRDWTPRELARSLNVHPRPLATQLREWSLLGFFTRTGLGTYRLNTPTTDAILDNRPRPLTTRLGLSHERCFRRSWLVGLGGREPVAEGDGECVQGGFPSHRPPGTAGPGRVQGPGDQVQAL